MNSSMSSGDRITFSKAFTYNDILIRPKFSDVMSRRQTSTSTNLTPNIKLNVPIVSSNMDTVTEDKMAIAMALNGGIGIIHRFCSIEDQVEMVKRVKRYTNRIIDNPYCVSQDLTIDELMERIEERGVGGFLVTDDEDRLVGIVTSRDKLYYETHLKQNNQDDNKYNQPQNVRVKDIMTKEDNLKYVEEPITYADALKVMTENRIEKLPIVDKNMKVKGLITAKDILYQSEFNNFSTMDEQGQLRVGAAVGTNKDYIDRTRALIDAGCDVIVIDVAHGHHKMVGEALLNIKKEFPKIDIIAGNVCTPDGTEYLIKCGADCIKVGVGPGSICITRTQTGCGFPQFSAVYNCAKVASRYGIPIIADGGHRGQIGSIVKGLAAGSSCSMLGGMLAGTTETPGPVIVKNNKKYKMIRGMAGRMSNLKKSIKNNEKIDIENMTPEGVEGYVAFKGDVKHIIHQIKGGIQSGLSYCGVHSIEELHKANIEFIIITNASQKESTFHDISVI